MTDVAVIGGGPAGMMAAYAAAGRGLRVLLLEQNEKLGKKLFITGKGRCNVTNACAASDFFSNIVRNPKFMMSSFHQFSNADLLELLQRNGLRTKTERGNRVFPISDKSSDVIRTLEKMLRQVSVEVRLNTAVQTMSADETGYDIATSRGPLRARAVIVATGGVSYPLTGSTGDGYRFAQAFSHTVVPPRPSLIALEDARHICEKMQGLTLKNIGFSLFQNKKERYFERGELLFTHFGISGPVVLTASCYLDFDQPMDLCAMIDLKPALDEKQLDARLLREFEANRNRQLKSCMGELLPSKLIPVFLGENALDGGKPVNQITKEERTRLVQSLKCFRIALAGTRPIEEAIVTAGGIETSEVNPSTMESKKKENLHFAGEVLDVSGKTGGFNLQIAFSTGYLAGMHVMN